MVTRAYNNKNKKKYLSIGYYNIRKRKSSKNVFLSLFKRKMSCTPENNYYITRKYIARNTYMQYNV